MIKVNILKNWHYPDLLQQTPNRQGVWGDVQFCLDSEQPSDYVIVLNHPWQDTMVTCSPQHIWAIMQEPPTEFNYSMHCGDPSYARIYTTDPARRGKKYFYSQPALPWHINRSYDFLKTTDIPQKTGDISWVTSNLTNLKGHRERMSFLESIRGELEFALFGRGFYPVEDKWQAIAPYRYSIAIENYSNPLYWSEKIADCFLAWTMPIYYGCTQITEYFPKEAMILIDIHNPDDALERIRESVASQRWQKNLDAISFAREQVLERYQFFPFIAAQIKQDPTFAFKNKAQTVFIPAKPRNSLSLPAKIRAFSSTLPDLSKRMYRKIKNLL